MSIKVTSLVWTYSQQKGSNLLLLLAISDNCHDNGTGAWPSIATLAHKSRMSERQVQRILKQLHQSGEIIIQYGQGPHGTNAYQIPLDQYRGDKMSPRQDVTPTPRTPGVTSKATRGDIPGRIGTTPMSPNPSSGTVKENHHQPSGDQPSNSFREVRRTYKAIMKVCNQDETLLDKLSRRQTEHVAKKIQAHHPDIDEEDLVKAILGFGKWWRGKGPSFDPPRPSTLLSHWSNYVLHCRERLGGSVPT